MPSGLAALVSPAKDSGAGQMAGGLCSPPRRFRAAGGVRSAWLCEGPFGRTPLRGSGAQRAGIRFERVVQRRLAKEFPGFLRGQWFHFTDQKGFARYCQVDGLLPQGEVVIFEVKTSFTSDAYFQLKLLYKPVVEAALKRPVTALIQVCKHFDPFRPFPEPVRMVESLTREAILGGDLSQIGVLVWRA